MVSVYSLIADIYEDAVDDTLYQTYIDLIARHTRPSKALEIGCGTARLSRLLAKIGYRMRAIDTETAMLTEASRRAYEDGVDIQFLDHDIETALQEMFPLIVMPHDLINHYPEPALKNIMNNVWDALVPGGVLVFDYLRQSFLEGLLGHKEILADGPESIEWEVLHGRAETLVHRIRRGAETARQSVWHHPSPRLFKHLTSSEPLETVEDDTRTIVAFRKKEK